MSHLQLVEGGGGSSGQGQPRFEDKLRHVRKIRSVVRGSHQGMLPPRATLAIVGGVLGLLVVFAGVELVGRWTRPLNGTVACSLAILGLVATFWAVGRFSTAPRTHVEHVDHLLGAYDPVSREAFRELQETFRRGGAFDFDLVLQWTEVEIAAIQAAAGWGRPTQSRFLNKRV